MRLKRLVGKSKLGSVDQTDVCEDKSISKFERPCI